MFRRNTLQGLAFLLVLSLVMGQGLLALLCALLLLTAGLARLWKRWSLTRVTYARELSHTRAFVGDEVELAIRVANRKPLPLAHVDIRDRIPAGLSVVGHDLKLDTDGRQLLHRSTSMRWYEALIWRYQVRCLARGAYRFGPAQIEAGDPFGFYRTVRDEPQRTSLVVYPQLLPLEELGLPPRHPLGELRARQLIRDPLRTIGVRDYHPDDPLKDVHWSATARVGTLQTRVYEPTTAREVAIFLDLDTFERYWQGIDEEQVERLISAAATVAQAGLADGYAVGLYVNGAPAEHEQLVRLPPGRSPAQLEHIMETLARLTPISITPMARLLRATSGSLPWGATLLLISAIASDSTRAALLRQRERGRDVAWLFLGDGPPQAPGVLVRHAPQRGDWRGNGHTKNQEGALGANREPAS
jgi:uncharacterized repeat protein (TIGR01451 family)